MIKTLLLGPRGSLVNRIVSHLVAVLLSLHMLLGCCWHHAHACSPACDGATAVCTHDHDDDGDGDDHCQQSTGNGHPQHPTDFCSGQRCSFVASPKTAAAGPRLDAPALGPWSLASSQLPAADGASLWQCACVVSSPPGRLHLIYQVLRI